MTVSLKHTTPADGTFSSAGAVAWDAEHALTMAGSGKVLGRTTAGTGAVEELTEITLASGTKTASAPVLSMSQTWNNAAVTFNGLLLNVTDTASNASSLLMDLQVGGTSKFSITKAGGINTAVGAALTLNYTTVATNGNWNFGGGSLSSLGGVSLTNNSNVSLSGTSSVNWSDVFLTRRAAANLRLGAADAAAPVAQTLSVQSVVAGTSNTAGANLTITGSQGTGTGAGGSIVFQVAPAGAAPTVQNTLVTTLTLDSVGSVRVVRALTVATLPGTPLAGMIARVSDALAPTIGMTVAAGGAAYALVNYNGANWTVIGV